MKYVRLIRRIDMINRAIDRIPDICYDERYDDIFDALWYKRGVLISELRRYIKGNDIIYTKDDIKARAYRRRQVKLACRLLGIDYRSVIDY